MRARAAAVLPLALLGGVLAGCADSGPVGGPAESSPTSTSPSESPNASPTGVPATPLPTTDAPTAPAPSDGSSSPAPKVQAAISDLADRLGVPTGSIDAGPLQHVTWPDGSLGCPQPDRAYPQVLTDGYRLILTVKGEAYAYHAGEDGELFYCADPGEPASTKATS